ncbi:hypothetical protein BD310DRAFT_953282 [Dichomitus squalens]|uniref:Uncharacterized protein n=1 Tax=Dichomitus squalens TaxID=114155 RepID=A0A4Q9PEL9_9APHY|nr:hypothetical protein BD310DRAFT_953282 [Dichomitus squalens]
MAQVRLEDAAVKRIGDISVKIREAIRASLPTGKEQYLHVMVPGKVVDFDDYTIDKENDVLIPTKVELKQAILCDDMPTLSPIQMGPSGRSVSRSYTNAIRKLIPAGTTVGVDEGKPLTDDQQRYKQAMSILSAEVEDKDMTLVELYTQKQAAYTRACAEKTRAFAEALEKATNSTKSAKAARQRYDQWVQENAKTWRNYVQAAYMDWVITGRKEEVEYWFSVVDQDSAMARVEQSKEIMRWTIVQDEDGGAEYQKVKLAPSHWANLAKEKANRGINNTKTVEWYTWEINRLEKTIELLELMKKKTVQPAGAPGSDAPDNEIEAQYKGAKTELSKPNKDESKDAWDGRKREAEGKYTSSQTALKKAQSAYDDANLAKLHMDGLAAVEIQRHKRTIEEYTRARAALMNQTGAKSAEIEKIATSVGIPAAMPDPTAVAAVESPDYFTPITVEVTSTSESKSSSSSASSMSFGASGSYGLFFTGSVSHESSEAHSEATQELANAAVKISFECMRVDITRPWLRPELFYDDDLQSLIRISPGFGRLRALMDSDPQLNMTEGQIASELAGYSIFPVFPTAFLLPCNVVLEISGSTSKLQTYMNSSSSSTSVAVGYGPFVAGKANHSSSSANQGSSCESTASGCRITMKSPQVIGWISQMVPALPRVSAPNEVAAAPHT